MDITKIENEKEEKEKKSKDQEKRIQRKGENVDRWLQRNFCVNMHTFQNPSMNRACKRKSECIVPSG